MSFTAAPPIRPWLSRWPVTPDSFSADRPAGHATGRHLARTLAVQALYAADIKGEGSDPISELEHLLTLESAADRPVEKAVGSYTRDLLSAVASCESAVGSIREVLSTWSYERLTPVERCILRVGLAELDGDLGVPPIVAIDEAILLAKEYGTKNSEKFINGVLDAIYKKKKSST